MINKVNEEYLELYEFDDYYNWLVCDHDIIFNTRRNDSEDDWIIANLIDGNLDIRLPVNYFYSSGFKSLHGYKC